MKKSILWAIALVFVAQVAMAQKTEKVDVQISAYQDFEAKVTSALEKYRADRLSLGHSPKVAKIALIGTLQTSVVDAFMSDKDKTVQAILAKPVTVQTTPNFICPVSKDYPKIQDAYKQELTNFWNMYAKFGSDGPDDVASTTADPTVACTEGDITVTTKVFPDHTEIITTIKNSGKVTQTSSSEDQTIKLNVPTNLVPYVLALVKEVTHAAEAMANAWQTY